MCFINDERGKKKKKGGKRYFLFTWFKGDFLRAIKSRIATYMFYIYIYVYITRIVRTYYVVVKHGENKRANWYRVEGNGLAVCTFCTCRQVVNEQMPLFSPEASSRDAPVSFLCSSSSIRRYAFKNITYIYHVSWWICDTRNLIGLYIFFSFVLRRILLSFLFSQLFIHYQ